jgi:hypothetical protein
MKEFSLSFMHCGMSGLLKSAAIRSGRALSPPTQKKQYTNMKKLLIF